jgi:hypothetical protein
MTLGNSKEATLVNDTTGLAPAVESGMKDGYEDLTFNVGDQEAALVNDTTEPAPAVESGAEDADEDVTFSVGDQSAHVQNRANEMAGKRPSKIPVFSLGDTKNTLCAELYGQLLKELGLLSHGGVVYRALHGFAVHTKKETKAGGIL